LAQYVEENRLGTVYAAETGFTLSTDPDTVRAPDVAFVSRARVEAVGEIEGFWPEAPDLAVEVVSPGDSYSEVEEKVFDWLEAGTKMVVVVNPRQRSATVYKSPSDITALVEADVLNGGGVVPGFELAVAAKSPARGLRRSTRRPRLYRGHSRRAPDRACAARRSLQCLGGQSVKKSAGLWLDH
jgi:Uma2 family endonuclease